LEETWQLTWRSKKQKVITQSSVKSEFQAVTQGTCEFSLVENDLRKLED